MSVGCGISIEDWKMEDAKSVAEYDQGLVPAAKSVVKRDDNVWTYEVAIPWSQIWEVKPKASERVRFTFYTRNDGGNAVEYANSKSVSVSNMLTFHPMWEDTWSNDCEWGFVE